MKFNKRNLFWIIPLIILIMAVVILIINPEIIREKPQCGDGICKESEIDSCILDCSLICETQAGEIEEECSVGWQQAYLAQLDQNNVSPEFLKEDSLIDYSNAEIQRLARQLQKDSAKETTKAIMKWTFDNIEYRSDNTYGDCKGESASEVIERRWGLCSTQSKVNLALLRANGIASYATTGCLSFTKQCERIQTFFNRPIPPFIEIQKDPQGFFPTRGGLHNSLFIWLPEEGWVRGESTTGILVEGSCLKYKDYALDPSDALVCGLNPIIPQQKEWVDDCRIFR